MTLLDAARALRGEERVLRRADEARLVPRGLHRSGRRIDREARLLHWRLRERLRSCTCALINKIIKNTTHLEKH